MLRLRVLKLHFVADGTQAKSLPQAARFSFEPSGFSVRHGAMVLFGLFCCLSGRKKKTAPVSRGRLGSLLVLD